MGNKTNVDSLYPLILPNLCAACPADWPRRTVNIPLIAPIGTFATGGFELLFLAGNLQFRATSFDWLVVDLVNKTAQFQGTGRINGKGSYKFMAWVDDSLPDKIRIKIWKSDGTVVYDTASKLPLLSGSIILHR